MAHANGITAEFTSNTDDLLSFTAQDHCLKILQNLRKLQQSALLCDVRITVELQCFVAHRALLSASSPYFQAMFSGGMLEEHKENINLHSISSETFGILLDFIYTGKIQINHGNVEELLAASDMLQLTDVLTACSTFLKRELQPENCIGIYHLAEAHLCQDLVDAAATFIHTNFVEVSKSEEFYDLPVGLLKTILESEYLKVENEFQVFEAAIRWILHDVAKRRCFVYEILDLVRILLISYRDLDGFISGLKDLSLKVALTKLIQDHKLELQLTSLESRLHQSVTQKWQPRKWAQKSLYVVGGFKRDPGQRWSDSRTLATVHRFNNYEQKWHAVTSLKEPRSGHGVTIANELLFVLGGENQGILLDDVYVYSLVTDCWMAMLSLSTPRCQMGAFTYDGYVYVVGGLSTEVKDTVERYDPLTRHWSTIGRMTGPRYAMGVVEHQGLVYVVGGRCHLDGDLSLVEVFNPVTEEWSVKASMREKRSYVGLAVLDNYMYAVGGSNCSKELNSVERYNFENNRWEKVAPMSVCRAGACVASINGDLFVIGGHSSAELSPSVTLNSMELYNPQTNTWKMGVPMPIGCSEAGVVAF